MANLTQHLTSISPDLRSGSSPGLRVLALVLCSMLVIGSVFPGVALAREADSEGEGTSPTIELPEPPEFDPGGEETGLEEEVPGTGDGGEGSAVENEAEVEIEAPPPEEVTGAATEAPVEAPPSSPPVVVPEPAPSAPQYETEKNAEPAASAEPILNQSITAPKQKPVDRHSVSESAPPPEAAPPAEPAEQEAPPSPRPAVAPPTDTGRTVAGRDSYVVRSGECLWQIAAMLLPNGADSQEIASEVKRLWELNEARIGTGDSNLIYAGTRLKVR